MHETQRYCVYEGGKRLVLELSTVALDVPYGDHFSVECRFDVTQVQVLLYVLSHKHCLDRQSVHGAIHEAIAPRHVLIATVYMQLNGHFAIHLRTDTPQGDWNNPEGKCHVSIRLETQFSKKTMWRKAIEAGSKSANVKGQVPCTVSILEGFTGAAGKLDERAWVWLPEYSQLVACSYASVP